MRKTVYGTIFKIMEGNEQPEVIFTLYSLSSRKLQTMKQHNLHSL